MKISFLIGLIISIIVSATGFILKNYNLSFKIVSTISVICLIISGILNGTFINGDKYRANMLSETKEDRNKRINIIEYILIFAFPNIVVALILFIILSK
ncbi:MAG: hypothetical protein E7208_12290 [Clostridium butyricum]|nr:hypothetical protein [Clostridium butyricum]